MTCTAVLLGPVVENRQGKCRSKRCRAAAPRRAAHDEGAVTTADHGSTCHHRPCCCCKTTTQLEQGIATQLPADEDKFSAATRAGTLSTNRPVADAANDSRRGLLCCKPNTLPSKATCWPKRPAGERSPANTSTLTTITTFRWRFKAISHVDTTSTTCAPCGPCSRRHLPHQSDGDLTARGLRARMNKEEPEPTTYCDPGCGQTPEPPTSRADFHVRRAR